MKYEIVIIENDKLIDKIIEKDLIKAREYITTTLKQKTDNYPDYMSLSELERLIEVANNRFKHEPYTYGERMDYYAYNIDEAQIFISDRYNWVKYNFSIKIVPVAESSTEKIKLSSMGYLRHVPSY